MKFAEDMKLGDITSKKYQDVTQEGQDDLEDNSSRTGMNSSV